MEYIVRSNFYPSSPHHKSTWNCNARVKKRFYPSSPHHCELVITYNSNRVLAVGGGEEGSSQHDDSSDLHGRAGLDLRQINWGYFNTFTEYKISK
uniref:Uncharacterized protein n=1 Tax=Oryza meridionalis TaxID=40149 RepID=A0A0E0F6J8_9ORYZ